MRAAIHRLLALAAAGALAACAGRPQVWTRPGRYTEYEFQSDLARCRLDASRAAPRSASVPVAEPYEPGESLGQSWTRGFAIGAAAGANATAAAREAQEVELCLVALGWRQTDR